VADINVVPKKRTSAWVWIVVALVVALIVWAIMSGSSGPAQPVSRIDLPAPGVVPIDVVPAPRA
jgi:bacteriorhodopsin